MDDDFYFQKLAESAKDMNDDSVTIMLGLMEGLRIEQKRMADIMDVRTKQVEDIDRKLDAHSAESNLRHAQILKAFPADDLDGHRRYHEEVIKRIELRNDIVRDCLKRASQLGFIGGLIWLGKAIFFYYKGGTP